jgi:hypothetical protein
VSAQSKKIEHVAITNLDDGVRSIAWYAGDKIERLRFVPGLNLVSPEKFAASQFEERKIKEDETLAGLEPVGNPCTLATNEAVALARRSTNRMALSRWLAAEKRAAVRAEIQSSLAGGRTSEEAEQV